MKMSSRLLHERQTILHLQTCENATADSPTYQKSHINLKLQVCILKQLMASGRQANTATLLHGMQQSTQIVQHRLFEQNAGQLAQK